VTFDLVLYSRLLVLLVGTFLYGFVARELLRRPRVLPGNVPMRLLVSGLTLGYSLGLAAELLPILAAGSPPRLVPALDVARALLWLAAFPLLPHALWRMLPGRRPSGLVLVPGYLTLLLFVPALARLATDPSTTFAAAAPASLPLLVAHTAVSAGVAGALIRAVRTLVENRGLDLFLRVSFRVLAGAALLNVAGLAFARGVAGPLWLLFAALLWLVLGAAFLEAIRRYSILRLSLSYRSLGHFAALLLLVFLAMVAGPAAGADRDVMRRLVAWGVLLAVLAGAAGTRLVDALAARSPLLRSLLGRRITPERLETLSRELERLERSDDELRALVADAISGWLGSRAAFLPEGSFHAHFRQTGTTAFTRIDPPDDAMDGALLAADLDAVFPLRAGDRLEGVLGLQGAGARQGELEAIALVLRQLGTVLTVRRLARERLEAERRLLDAERLSMLGLVAASLAHELKNPLSSIKALAQSVREETPAGSTHAEDLAVIVDQIDRLAAVTSQVLDFARPKGAVDLPRLVSSALYVLSAEGRKRGVTLDASGVTDPGPVPGTAADWQTVVFNLVLNAVQHAPAGSAVAVRLSREGPRVRFETENGGPPIPGDVAARLAQPFVTEGGTGLGLALVARRVGEMGGRLGLANEPGRVVVSVVVGV